MRHLMTILISVPLLLLTLIAAQAQVQPTFNIAPQYTGGFPVAIADFNQDGHPDIVSAASVLLGNGDGTFRTGTPLSVPPKCYCYIATGDFNGDGKPDVAFLHGSILIFLGNGDGTFRAPLTVTPGNSFTYFVAADLNNDGKPDLVTVDGGALHVYLGNGDGTFKPLQPNFSQGVQYVADFNGDGKPDILSTSDSSINVWLGNGDGTFQSTPLISSLTLGETLAAVADLNHDGKIDLAVSIATNGLCGDCTYAIASRLGNGDGTFQPLGPQTSVPPDTPYYSDQLPGLAVGDVNGDGNPDVVYALTGPIIGILTGNGDGTFTYGNSYAVTSGGGANGVVLADVNGDRKLDIITGQVTAHSKPPLELSVLTGGGDGTFEAAPALGDLSFPSSPVAADFNGDESPDIAVSNDDGTISIFLDTPNGLVLSGSFPGGVEGYTSELFAADLNHDGSQDLLGHPENHGLFELLGNGDGTFGPQITLPWCGSGIAQLQGLADFNGDGIPDLISTDSTDARVVYICLGTGDGMFGPATQNLAGPNPGGAVFGDFNGDGKLDMAVDNLTTVGILLGYGDGTFQPVTFPISTSRQLDTLAAVDVNLDGKLDLLGVDESGQLDIFLGNGDGTFHALHPQGSGIFGPILLSDLNGDGKPDLLMPESNLCLGQGDGTFSCTPFLYGSNGYGSGDVIADFNGDRKPDIALADSYALVVLTNTTAQTFSLSASVLSPSSVSPGGSSTSTVDIGSIFGFNASVKLSCSSITLNGSPATTDPPTCSFNPATLPSGSGTSTLTVSTTGSTSMLSPHRINGFRLSYAMWLPICAIALIGVGTASRKRTMFALLLALALCSLVLLPGCGGGGSGGGSSGGGGGGGGSSGTPAGTYTITVKASASGHQAQTTTVTLTVK